MAGKKRRARKRKTAREAITKVYKGKTLTVEPVDEGFRFRGRTYGSLTAVAREVTGAEWISGPFFFGLTRRKVKDTNR
jgi:hypothetical protein